MPQGMSGNDWHPRALAGEHFECQFGNYLRVTEGYLRMKAMETRLRARRAPFGLPAEGALGSGQEPTSEQRCTFTTPSSNTPLRPALNVSLYSSQNSA